MSRITRYNFKENHAKSGWIEGDPIVPNGTDVSASEWIDDWYLDGGWPEGPFTPGNSTIEGTFTIVGADIVAYDFKFVAVHGSLRTATGGGQWVLTPEPTTAITLALGLIGLAFLGKKRRRPNDKEQDS